MLCLGRIILIAGIASTLYLKPVVAQSNEGGEEVSQTLYSRGLQACLEKEIAEFSKFSERDLRKVTVESNFDLTRRLPNKLGEIELQYLSDQELARKFKALPKSAKKRGIPFIKIFPLTDKGGKLYFAYNTYWFSYSKSGGFLTRKNYIFRRGLEGGCRAEFEFDITLRDFVVTDVELWGI